MKLIRNLAALPEQLRGGAVAIGNFDGVHLGHARIVAEVIAQARQVSGPAVIFTFDPHPAWLLRPSEAPPPLTWTERKVQLLVDLGVDSMIAYPTDEALLALSPREFFEQIVRRQLDAKAMVEGPNFYFGHNRAGNIRVLAELCQKTGISLDIVEPVVVDGDYVSSSRVRKLISAGDVQAANRMLTQPYRIRGMVTHGAGRGGKLGFPTANVGAVDTLLPAAGVYAGRAHVDGSTWPAAINLGPNPTFGEHAIKVEVHLIGYAGSLYGQPLEVDFLARLRDIRPFPSVAALKKQLEMDITATRELSVVSRQ